jgi:hypothetical protein
VVDGGVGGDVGVEYGRRGLWEGGRKGRGRGCVLKGTGERGESVGKVRSEKDENEGGKT